MSAEAAHAMYDPNVTLVELATSTAVNWTKIVADQRKERNRLDREMPRDILLAVTAVVLFGMLMTHARFFARLYASLPLPSRSSASATRGGDLAQGWFFRQGKLALESTTVYDEKMQEEIVPQTAPPPHVRPLLAYLPYSSALLFAPLSRFPNPFRSYMSIPQLFFILCLVFLAVFSLSYRADMTPSTKHKGNGEDYMRSGEVSMSLMPVAIALAVRGNIVGLCVSNGYEKLRIFHKVVGRLIFVATVIHTVGYFVKWVRADNVNEHAYLGYVIWGYVALIALFIMVVSSLPMIRNMWYGVFKVCHVAGVILMIVALGFHRPRAMPYAAACGAIYGASIMCSIFKTRLATARIVALPGADTTLITIPELRSGWRPGQHVRIRVPAFGLVRGFESHPFTIASAPNGEGLVLMCKKAGDWTTRLNHHAAAGSITETGEKGRHITIILEGPYGGLGNTMISSYSGAMLVAGGSGITSALGHATGLIARAPTGAVRTRTIDLVWLVRTEEIAKPFVKILSDLVDEAKRWEQKCIRAQGGLRPVALRVHVFITRCSIDSPPNLLPYSPSSGSSGGSSSASLEDDKSVRLESGDLNTFTTTSLTMTNGNTSSEVLSSITVKTLRPSFIAVLSGITDETIERGAKEGHSPSGILVTACGPGGMVFTVSESVRLYEEYKKKLVGGVDFEAQHFGW